MSCLASASRVYLKLAANRLFFAEKALFYVLLLGLSVQAGGVLFSFGAPFNPFEAGFAYWLDLVLLALLALWAVRSFLWSGLSAISVRKKLGSQRQILVWIVLGFLAWAALSLAGALNPFLGLYSWGRLALMAGLFLYIVSSFKFYNFKIILWLLVIGGLFQAGLGMGQFLLQHDLGLQLLGEPVLVPDILGVAKIDIGGTKIVRAYGLYPHPNILAAFLVLSLFALIGLFFEKKRALPEHLGLFGAAFVVLGMGLFLTFSRAAWLALGAAGLIWFFLSYYGGRTSIDWPRVKFLGGVLVLLLLALTALFGPLFLERLALNPEEPAVANRVFYLKTAGQLFQNSPVLGVGLGQFVPNFKLMSGSLFLPDWIFQPVHNIYALIAAELGLVGLLTFAIFLALVLRRALIPQYPNILISILIAFLIIGSFDHFFWSLPAGQYLFWLALGLAAASGRQAG
jgi:O-antigen ligase